MVTQKLVIHKFNQRVVCLLLFYLCVLDLLDNFFNYLL